MIYQQLKQKIKLKSKERHERHLLIKINGLEIDQKEMHVF